MEALDVISKFFEYDIKIKKDIVKLELDERFINDRSYLSDYVDNAYKTLYDIIITFGNIMDTLEIDNSTQEYVVSFLSGITNEFYECGYDGLKLDKFFHKYIADMDPDILAKVSMNLAAGIPSRSYIYPIRTSHTINEILHIFHQYVINHDELFRIVPTLKFVTDNKGIINYKGKESNLSNKLFKSLSSNIIYYPYYTTILSVDNNKNILLMQGLAHATSFEIDRTEQGDLRVEYLIPKAYEVNGINKLNGIDKIHSNSPVMRGATGRFYTTEDELGMDIFKIVSNIPTEEDLEKSPDKHKRI